MLRGTPYSRAPQLRRDRLAAALPWGIIAAASALRLELYVHNRSFWLDESLLGLNLLERSTAGLLRPLDYVQSAPIGFLLAQKGALGILGESERALRLLPFVESVAGLVVFWWVARRLLARRLALLALILFAVNSTLVYQSSEAKPYSGDVLVGLVLMWLTLDGLEASARGRPVRALLPLTIASVVLLWISYPAIFFLVACYGAVLIRAYTRGGGEIRRFVLVSACAVGASAVGVYVVASRSTATVRSAVFAGDPQTSSRLRGVAQAAWETLSDPGGFTHGLRAVVLILLLVGFAAMAVRREFERLTLLAAPGALAVVAALLDAYPLGGRFSLFLIPSIMMMTAAGAGEIFHASRDRALVGIPLVLLVTGLPVYRSLDTAVHPPSREDVRPLIQLLNKSWRAGDTLYVYRNAQYALRFYAECRDCGARPYKFPLRDAAPGPADNGGLPAALASVPPAVLVGQDEATPAESLRALAPLRGRRRLWLLFSHSAIESASHDEEQFFLSYLDTIGQRRGSWLRPGAALYLYDTSGTG